MKNGCHENIKRNKRDMIVTICVLYGGVEGLMSVTVTVYGVCMMVDWVMLLFRYEEMKSRLSF
jgi:hypothetical protein